MTKHTQRSCRNFMLRVQKIIFLLRKTYKNLKCLVLFYLQQKRLCETYRHTCQKCTCIVHSNILKKTIFLKIRFFFFFWNFECKFYFLWQIKFSEVIKTSFWVSALFFEERSFFEKFKIFASFFDFELIVRSLFVEKAWRFIKTEF